MSSIEYIQAQIDILHEQLDAKQLELDAKYEERNKILRKERDDCQALYGDCNKGNIESNFQEDAIDDMTNDCEDLYGDENFDFI